MMFSVDPKRCHPVGLIHWWHPSRRAMEDEMFIVAAMRPAVQPCSVAAYTPLDSLGLFPTCVNTSHVDNFQAHSSHYLKLTFLIFSRVRV